MSAKSTFSNSTSKSYAVALYELAKENSELSNVVDGMNGLKKLLNDKQALEKQVSNFQGIISKFKTEKSSEIASKVLLNHL